MPAFRETGLSPLRAERHSPLMTCDTTRPTDAESAPPIIRIATALILRDDGHVLLVRKRGSVFLMQPGGKIEPGETTRAALIRELGEELALTVTAEDLTEFGLFRAQAANEPGAIVEARVFLLVRDVLPRPAAEIEEALWIDPAAIDGLPLAALTRDEILPAYRRREETLAARRHADVTDGAA